MEPLLTIPEVAEYLRISRSKMYAMVQRGEVPYIRIGRNVRIRQSDLEKWLEDQTVWVQPNLFGNGRI